MSCPTTSAPLSDAGSKLGAELADRGDTGCTRSCIGEAAHQSRADDHAVGKGRNLRGLGTGGDTESDTDRRVGHQASPGDPVSYTHLRAHETRHDLVCRLLLEKKKNK